MQELFVVSIHRQRHQWPLTAKSMSRQFTSTMCEPPKIANPNAKPPKKNMKPKTLQVSKIYLRWSLAIPTPKRKTHKTLELQTKAPDLHVMFPALAHRTSSKTWIPSCRGEFSAKENVVPRPPPQPLEKHDENDNWHKFQRVESPKIKRLCFEESKKPGPNPNLSLDWLADKWLWVRTQIPSEHPKTFERGRSSVAFFSPKRYRWFWRTVKKKVFEILFGQKPMCSGLMMLSKTKIPPSQKKEKGSEERRDSQKTVDQDI